MKLLKEVTLATAVFAVVACTDTIAPRSRLPRPSEVPNAETSITTDPQSGLKLTVGYPLYIFAGYEYGWWAQAKNGTPPYTYYWDGTICQPDPVTGKRFAEFTQTTASASTFLHSVENCDTNAFAVNLYVVDAAGRTTSWRNLYTRPYYYR